LTKNLTASVRQRLMNLARARKEEFVVILTRHIAAAAKFLGNMSADVLDQMAGQVVSPLVPFEVVQEFEHLRSNPNRSPGTLR
jgi:GGDEF domain-containing protein